MAADQSAGGGLGGGSAGVETAQGDGLRRLPDADVDGLRRLLDDGGVREVAAWLDAMTSHPETRVGSLSAEQQARREVASKLKRLETLKRAADKLESRLLRQQHGLALQLAPGLSDRCLGMRHRREDGCRSFPLSYAQQQMLALQHMDPDSAAYNVTRAVRVTAELPLDGRALEAAAQSLLAKHETLRTLFELDAISGEPQQVVMSVSSISVRPGNDQARSHPVMHAVVRVLDWTGTAAEYANDSAVGEFVASQFASVSFDLARELPVRIIAIREPGGIKATALRWTLVVVLHHIVTDGASSEIFWRDLFESYTCLLSTDLASTTGSLASREPVVHYRDYAVWQRERVQSGALNASIAYWCRQFDSAERGDDGDTRGLKPLPVLELPFDKKPANAGEAAANALKGAVVKFRASDAALERMTALCQSRGCSLFMGLLAVFFELLSRLSGGATDVTIGTPVSTRDREELQQVMGYFVNTLPLRIRSGSSNSDGVRNAPGTSSDERRTFTELLQSVRSVVLNAFAHMEVPFHEILEHIRASTRRQRQMQLQSYGISSAYEMDESRLHPLYQVMFALEHGAVSASNGCRGRDFGPEVLLPHATAKFDLMLTMRVVTRQLGGDTTSALEGEMEFPLDRFTRESVERFTRYYCELLEQVTRLPDKSLDQISMLSRGDQRVVVETWGSPRPLPASAIAVDQLVGAFASPFIDECLRRQVQLTPSNWALHFDDGGSWTYAMLWRESSRVLLALTGLSASRGAGNTMRDTGGGQLRVGLFLPRGLTNAAAIVGAMRARAVFIPLDSTFPRERLRYMIRDAALHAIVTQRSHETKLSELLAGEAGDGCSWMEKDGGECVDVRVLTWEDLPDAGDGNDGLLDVWQQQSRQEENAAAYILYTSGVRLFHGIRPPCASFRR